MDSSTRGIVVFIALLVLLGAGVWWWYSIDNTVEVENNGMTDVTPPAIDDDRPAGVPENWDERSVSVGSFYYPEDFGSNYVSVVDWPPDLRIEDETFACTEAGEETERAGGTESVNVGGREYCRTVNAEGAAGSVYRQYAYAFSHEDGIAIFTFSARFPQCANYEEEEAGDCEVAQSNFEPDIIVSQMVNSISWD